MANVGDSRAMMGTARGAVPLSRDQTPFSKAERERVQKCGGRIMSADQVDGLVPYHENWDCNLGEELDDDGDPPRVWNQDLEYPGTAFTRSIGDRLAEEIGVVAEPEARETRPPVARALPRCARGLGGEPARDASLSPSLFLRPRPLSLLSRRGRSRSTR